jgi:hypothetical protein
MLPPTINPADGSGLGVIELDALDEADVPFALTAAIVNVYACAVAKVPVTVNGLEVPDTEREIDGLLVTV